MGSLWLYAIAIDEVRDVFGADEADAAALRAIAAERFAPPPAPHVGLLDKVGPLFRRQAGSPVRRPDLPDGLDVERLLTGRHVPPERLAASWTLLRSWLDAKAWSSYEATLDEAAVKALDFDLARAGAPAHFALGSLLSRDLGIALRTAPGMAAGYSRGTHVLAAKQAWDDVVDRLEPTHQQQITRLLAWLGLFEEWTRAAPLLRREPPDLVAIWMA